MRHRLLRLGVALLLLAATAPAEEATGPRIRVEPTAFDFGRVLPRRTVRKEFRLRNLGDRALVIEKISWSCGCTDAVAEEATLAPGDSTPLLGRLNTRSAAGPIEESVLLRSNDPEIPLLEVVLRATVVAE